MDFLTRLAQRTTGDSAGGAAAAPARFEPAAGPRVPGRRLERRSPPNGTAGSPAPHPATRLPDQRRRRPHVGMLHRTSSRSAAAERVRAATITDGALPSGSGSDRKHPVRPRTALGSRHLQPASRRAQPLQPLHDREHPPGRTTGARCALQPPRRRMQSRPDRSDPRRGRPPVVNRSPRRSPSKRPRRRFTCISAGSTCAPIMPSAAPPRPAAPTGCAAQRRWKII